MQGIAAGLQNAAACREGLHTGDLLCRVIGSDHLADGRLLFRGQCEFVCLHQVVDICDLTVG